MAPPRIRALTAGVALVATSTMTAAVTTAPAAPASSASSTATTPAVEVIISKARVITMPDTVQPGVNTFKITSAREGGSAFQLLRPAEGYTPAQATRDINKGFKGKVKALKRFEANVTLFGGVTADDTADKLVVALEPGTYWATDTNGNDPDKIATFSVSGDQTGNTIPAATTITAKKATSWARSPKSIPKKGLLNFKNASSNNHFIVMVKLRKGKNFHDFKEWFEAEGGPQGPPPVNFDVGLDSGALSPGYSAVFDYRIPKGNYVMLCFWPDAAMGGMPHAFMGMYRPLTVK